MSLHLHWNIFWQIHWFALDCINLCFNFIYNVKCLSKAESYFLFSESADVHLLHSEGECNLLPNQGSASSFGRKIELHSFAQWPCWITFSLRNAYHLFISMQILRNWTLSSCYRGYETQNKPLGLLLRNSRGVFTDWQPACLEQ